MGVSNWRAWPLLFMMQLLSIYVDIGKEANLYIPTNASGLLDAIKNIVYFSPLDSPIV